MGQNHSDFHETSDTPTKGPSFIESYENSTASLDFSLNASDNDQNDDNHEENMKSLQKELDTENAKHSEIMQKLEQQSKQLDENKKIDHDKVSGLLSVFN